MQFLNYSFFFCQLCFRFYLCDFCLVQNHTFTVFFYSENFNILHLTFDSFGIRQPSASFPLYVNWHILSSFLDNCVRHRWPERQDLFLDSHVPPIIVIVSIHVRTVLSWVLWIFSSTWKWHVCTEAPASSLWSSPISVWGARHALWISESTFHILEDALNL